MEEGAIIINKINQYIVRFNMIFELCNMQKYRFDLKSPEEMVNLSMNLDEEDCIDLLDELDPNSICIVAFRYDEEMNKIISYIIFRLLRVDDSNKFYINIDYCCTLSEYKNRIIPMLLLSIPIFSAVDLDYYISLNSSTIPPSSMGPLENKFNLIDITERDMIIFQINGFQPNKYININDMETKNKIEKIKNQITNGCYEINKVDNEKKRIQLIDNKFHSISYKGKSYPISLTERIKIDEIQPIEYINLHAKINGNYNHVEVIEELKEHKDKLAEIGIIINRNPGSIEDKFKGLETILTNLNIVITEHIPTEIEEKSNGYLESFYVWTNQEEFDNIITEEEKKSLRGLGKKMLCFELKRALERGSIELDDYIWLKAVGGRCSENTKRKYYSILNSNNKADILSYLESEHPYAYFFISDKELEDEDWFRVVCELLDNYGLVQYYKSLGFKPIISGTYYSVPMYGRVDDLLYHCI